MATINQMGKGASASHKILEPKGEQTKNYIDKDTATGIKMDAALYKARRKRYKKKPGLSTTPQLSDDFKHYNAKTGKVE